MITVQDRANQHIAQGALTNSKRPETFVKGVYPTHLKMGKGCEVWDLDGKKYYDFITGLGCNLLGYAQEDVNDAIVVQMMKGATLSLSTTIELDLAERIKTIFPFIDCMKFLKTGTEACAAAIRIARAYKPGRHRILSEGYHGWSDGFVSLTPPAYGVSGDLKFEKLPDTEDSITWITEAELFDVAAIIVEPIMTKLTPERAHYLRHLRNVCTAAGCLLIFDEVITGFRFPRFSVSNYLEIEPDLIVMGKAMANGLPLSLVGGKKHIMNCCEYFVSSTFAGETLSMAAACKTIDLLKSKFKLEYLWQQGEAWLKAFNEIWPEGIQIEGYPTRGRFVADPLVKALFFQESIESGLLFGPSWFFNFPLAEKHQITIGAVKDIIWKIKSGNVKLKGEMPKSPFADQVRRQ